MSSSSFSPDEVRAAAEIHHELGPDYQSAVIDSFIDKVGKEIDARVDARLALGRQYSPPLYSPPPNAPARARGHSPSIWLAICSMVLGIPLTAIALAVGRDSTGFLELLVIWMAIAVINVAYAAPFRRPPGR